MGSSSNRSKKRQRPEEEEEEEEEQEVNDNDSESGLEDGSDTESDEIGEEEEDDEDDDDDEEGEEDAEEEDDGGGGDRTGVRGGAEMEELEKEYQSLRHEEQSLLKNLRRQKDEDISKGQAVKHQKALWDRTLEFRFLLQKAFSNSNKLPQEPLRASFCNSDKAVDQAYSELISSSEQTLNCLLELQEALIEKNPSITQGTDGVSNGINVENDEDWSRIQRIQCRIAPFRNSSVDKWQRKTQVTSGAAAFKGKLHAFNRNISEQVAAYMRDPSRMVMRMQLRRSTVGVFGEVPEEVGTTKEEDGNVDGDPELIDDSEFYQQLLKEFLESCDLTSSEAAFYALKKSQTKKRKIVDRRASKSRKIRYNVHEKIVNFMAPLPTVLPPMAPKLFENLFGLRKQGSTSAL